MAIHLDITFRDIDPSEAIEGAIRKRADKLATVFDRILGVRVVVAAPHRRQNKGILYEVTIEIDVPGDNVIVDRRPGDVNAHEDVYVAIRDAFNAAQRQLQDHRRKLAGAVKVHGTPPHGRIVRLFKDQGYGFIAMPDGREYYFHRNSVLNDAFERLEIDSEVRFAPEQGAEGPQASSVQPVGKHHLGDFVPPRK